VIGVQEVDKHAFLFCQDLVPICSVLVGSLGSTSTAFVSSVGQKALDGVGSLQSAMPSTTVSWSL
jgi:hypothetical protein